MMLFDDENNNNASATFSLSQLNGLVREAIELTMDGCYWVEAELANVRENRGHCYMELIEKDARTHTPVAQARACCWANTWQRTAPRFVRATGQELHAGMKVRLMVKASFHEAFGFSWVVLDIDPDFTMGDMARRRQEILRTLREEGVLELNKTLRVPMFAKRIAVISSATAAGYGDFCNQLAENDYGFAFTTRLFPAVMQGEQVEQSVIRALDAVNAEGEDYDVVVIIRGGGSTADLSGFDTLALAENVANFPLPIITGIGHDRDQSVLDVIACVSMKTPTAVAAYLIDNLAATLADIDEATQRIGRAVQGRMEMERMRLQRVEQYVGTSFTLRKAREEARIAALEQRLPWLLAQRMEREGHRLQMLQQRTASADPVNILRRGFSITLRQGKAVTAPGELAKGDDVTILLAEGSVKATVK